MKRLITETDILHLRRSGSTILFVEKGAILTPLAKDSIKAFGITVSTSPAPESGKEYTPAASGGFFSKRRAVIASDHTGFRFKQEIIKKLTELGSPVIDVGTNSEESVDYPDFTVAAVNKILSGEVDFGIVLDATGNPSALTANKFPRIRAAVCYNEFTVRSARAHNDANILALGARSLGIDTIFSILHVWLHTAFEGGRHLARLRKIQSIERTHTD